MQLPYALRPHSRRKALVAAGDLRTRRYLQEALSRAGYASESCSDVQRVLDPQRTDGHAFIILNDGVDGCEVLRRLRQAGGSIPAILLSGGPEQPPEGAARDVGHLATPFTLRTLEAAIARVCPGLSWPGRSK